MVIVVLGLLLVCSRPITRVYLYEILCKCRESPFSSSMKVHIHNVHGVFLTNMYYAVLGYTCTALVKAH